MRSMRSSMAVAMRVAVPLLLLSALRCSAQYNTLFSADLSEVSSSGVGGTAMWGAVDGLLIGRVSLSGYSANVSTNNCTDANACTVHITDGTDCSSTGSDYYTSSANPWTGASIESTDSAGSAVQTFSMTQTSPDIDGKLVVVYDTAGAQAACGVLSAMSGELTYASLTNLSSSGVSGSVSLSTDSAGAVSGFGVAYGLEAELSSSGGSCTAQNGCGVHVHSGTACDPSADQGGHYWSPATDPDPWATIIYESTTSAGLGTFFFYAAAGTPSIADKPFIVHNNAGGRVACGVLTEFVSTTVPAADSSGGAEASGAVLGVTAPSVLFLAVLALVNQ